MAESFSQIYLHIIFSTKRREELISKEIRQDLYRYMAQIIRNRGCNCYRIGGIEDHVHIACSLSRTLSIAELVRDIKNNSSKWISEKKRYFKWQDGYAAFSISPNHIKALKSYIDHQEAHHREVTSENELCGLFEKYKISEG